VLRALISGVHRIAGCNNANTLGVLVSSADAHPAARYACKLLPDSSGSFLFTFGGGSRVLTFSDTWRFSIASRKWVHVHGVLSSPNDIAGPTLGVYGPSFIPRSRYVTACLFPAYDCCCSYGVGMAIDSSDTIWMFGGRSFTSVSNMNDLWKFSTSLLQWANVSSSSAGSLGPLGVPSVQTYPGNEVTEVVSVGHCRLWFLPMAHSTVSGNFLFEYNSCASKWTW
jgi:hypothetical protein